MKRISEFLEILIGHKLRNFYHPLVIGIGKAVLLQGLGCSIDILGAVHLV